MRKYKISSTNLFVAIVIVPIVSILTITIRNIGWLQPFELMALDEYFQLRPTEPLDDRVVIVGVSERDIENLRGWPTNDWLFAELLNRIKSQQPRVIGFNIFRNKPINPGHAKLLQVYKTTPYLIGIEKLISSKSSPSIAPPPLLKQMEQVAASDLILDPDGVIRRGILFPKSGDGTQSLGLAVALIYLNKQGINPEAASNGFMKLGSTVFPPLNANDGGYVRTNAGGYQILLNFQSPGQSFPIVSITDVLYNRISPELMSDRIVLIGGTAPSFNDAFLTPYSRGFGTAAPRTSGVEIQANVASQIIDAALGERPLIRTWNDLSENLWTVLWSAIVVTLGWRWRHDRAFIIKVSASFVLGVACLIIGTYLAFIVGWWIPVVPPLVGLIISTLSVTGCVYVYRLREAENKALMLDYKLSMTKQILEQAKERSPD